MKKYLYLSAVACFTLFASCSSNNDENGNIDANKKVAMSFGVSLEQGTVTRAATSFSPTNTSPNVNWEEGDQISVFVAGHSTGDVFDLAKIADGTGNQNQATFDGMSYATGPYYILYPAQTSARISDDGALSFNIPSTQKAVSGSFDPKAGVQIGKADSWESHISINHVCAYFAVKVDEGCTNVEIIAYKKTSTGYEVNPDWHLAGDVVVGDARSGNYAITGFGSNVSNSINLKGGDLSKGGYFLIPFIPTTGCSALRVAASYNGTGASHFFYPTSSATGFQFSIGSIYNMGYFKYNSGEGAWSSDF